MAIKAVQVVAARGKAKNNTVDGPTDYEQVPFDTRALFKDVEEACDKFADVTSLLMQVDMQRWAKDKGGKYPFLLKRLEKSLHDVKSLTDTLYNYVQD
jgi:hypothetical protein